MIITLNQFISAHPQRIFFVGLILCIIGCPAYVLLRFGRGPDQQQIAAMQDAQTVTSQFFIALQQQHEADARSFFGVEARLFGTADVTLQQLRADAQTYGPLENSRLISSHKTVDIQCVITVEAKYRTKAVFYTVMVEGVSPNPGWTLDTIHSGRSSLEDGFFEC